MRFRSSLAAVGLAAGLTFTLAGCFSPSPTSPTTEESAPAATEESAPPAISADPATGELITGTGYSFNAPEGWGVPADAPSADAFVVAPADADGFYNTVNVLFGPTNGDSPDTVETMGTAYLESIGATDIQVRPRIAIAGTETVHFSAGRSSNGASYWSEQYIVATNGLDYTVTFVFNPAMPQADREALAESVFASWAWTD